MTSTTNTDPTPSGGHEPDRQDAAGEPPRAGDAPGAGQSRACGAGSGDGPEGAGSGPPAQNKTLKRLQNYSVRNMIYSLLAVFALAFGLWAMMPSEDGDLGRRPVEVGMVASYAATESAGPIWSPATLGEDWSANFANYQLFEDLVSWRVGLVTPSQDYVEISQTDEADEGWVNTLTDKAGEQVGTRTITGPDGPQEWTAYEGEERAVVLDPDEGRENTTVVRGTAEWAEIEQFIGQLEVVPGD